MIPRTIRVAIGLTGVIPGWPLWRMLRHRRSGIVGLVLIAQAVLIAGLAPLIVSYDPQILDPSDRLTPPGSKHWFGTDNFGRDVFSRVVYGSHISLFVGAAVAALTSGAGLLSGMVTGYYPLVDMVWMRVMDGLMAFPGIVLAIAIMAAVGPNVFNVVVALAVVHLPRVSRIVRSRVLAIRETEYLYAAKALGASDPRILRKHVLPNCASPLTVQATFAFAQAVLGEAALSFLGVGVPPYVPSWGIMLSEARLYMQQAPWLGVFPGLAIFLVVLGINLVGDTIRDMLDPRFRGFL